MELGAERSSRLTRMMSSTRGGSGLPLLMGGAISLLHLLTASDTYGLFRDELYYVACASNLDFGYVDHPPLVALLTALSRAILGDSQVALRFLPAVAAGLTVMLTALMVRELGGGRQAQVLGGTCAALAPVYIGNFGFLSMNAYDVLIWTGLVWIMIRLFGTGDARWWVPFGVLAGMGLQNKLSVVFLGFGLVVGLVMTRDWKQFRSGRFWLGGAIAFAIFLPHLIWQAIHGWPTLEFMRNATQYKNLPLSPVDFLSSQVLMMNPLAVPVALAGLGFYLFARAGRPYRALGWAFIAVTVLMITQRSKAYYLSPAYTMLFAPGAVMVARLAASPRWKWVGPSSIALILLSGVALAPMAKPVLSVERFVAYQAFLGQEPSTGERKQLGRLPQFFADRLGWRELAESVAAAYQMLPDDEKKLACVFGQNYGHAAAIDHYSPSLGMPAPALSGHNSYHIWGTRGCSGEVMIVIDDDRETLERLFEDVVQAGIYTCDDCMPYESRKAIWICRRPRTMLEELWPRLKHYD